MKVNDKKELHGKEASELKKMLKDGHELLLSLQLDRQQNKLKNTRAVFTTRKNIAIIKTILKGKEEQSQIKDQKSNLKNDAAVVAEPMAAAKQAKEKKGK